MDSRSGSGDISEDGGELSRLRRERHRLLLRVRGGRISVAAGDETTKTDIRGDEFGEGFNVKPWALSQWFTVLVL